MCFLFLHTHQDIQGLYEIVVSVMIQRKGTLTYVSSIHGVWYVITYFEVVLLFSFLAQI
jgi:hypothetical protein